MGAGEQPLSALFLRIQRYFDFSVDHNDPGFSRAWVEPSTTITEHTLR